MNSHSILLVQDCLLVRQAISQLIEGESGLCGSGEAASADSALEQLERLKSDWVITDLSLPNMTGLGLIERLRSSLTFSPNASSG